MEPAVQAMTATSGRARPATTEAETDAGDHRDGAGALRDV